MKLTLTTPMYRIAKSLAAANSGLEVKDRVWLKMKIPKSFIGRYTIMAKLCLFVCLFVCLSEKFAGPLHLPAAVGTSLVEFNSVFLLSIDMVIYITPLVSSRCAAIFDWPHLLLVSCTCTYVMTSHWAGSVVDSHLHVLLSVSELKIMEDWQHFIDHSV